jgi:hypothetical protein
MEISSKIKRMISNPLIFFISGMVGLLIDWANEIFADRKIVRKKTNVL